MLQGTCMLWMRIYISQINEVWLDNIFWWFLIHTSDSAWPKKIALKTSPLDRWQRSGWCNCCSTQRSAALQHLMAESFIYKYSWQLREGGRCCHMSDVHLQSKTFCCPERACCDTGQGFVTLCQHFHLCAGGMWKALNIKVFFSAGNKQYHRIIFYSFNMVLEILKYC